MAFSYTPYDMIVTFPRCVRFARSYHTNYTRLFFNTDRQKDLNSSTKLKPKTQGKNSTSGRHVPPFEKNSRKKPDFTNFSLKTEIFLWGATIYAIFMNKYFQILPTLTVFTESIEIFRIFFGKIEFFS